MVRRSVWGREAPGSTPGFPTTTLVFGVGRYDQ